MLSVLTAMKKSRVYCSVGLVPKAWKFRPGKSLAWSSFCEGITES